MEWSRQVDRGRAELPAGWLIETGRRPRNLVERRALRGLVARRVLAARFRLPLEAVEIGHDERGRPRIEGALARAPALAGGAAEIEPAPLHLSLATRGGVVAIALAEGPVGVDVECVEDVPRPLPLNVLHPSERALLRDLPHDAGARAFARLWAAKEAYVKALGLGFARAPDSFALRFTLRGPEIDDPSGAGVPSFAESGLTRIGAARFAAALVVLAP